MATQAALSLWPARDALVVVRADADRSALAPMHLLSKWALREEPRLLRGLPMAERRAAEGSSDSPLGKLPGRVTLSGRWPDAAKLRIDSMPDGGCAGCWDEYEWRTHEWVEVAKAPWLPIWFDPSGGVSTSRVTFPDGTEIWEKFEGLEVAGSYFPEGKSVFYADPYAKRRARRQRTRGPARCHGGVRITGHFSGVSLQNGGLLSVGPDCVTGIANVEYWSGASVRSRITELPNEPRGPTPLDPFDDIVSYLVRSPTDVVVAFNAEGAEPGTLRTYVAAFDGATWTDLSPGGAAAASSIERLADGSLWLVTGGETLRIWRHPGLPAGRAAWRDVTPDVLGEAPYDIRLTHTGAGRVWLGVSRWVLEWLGSEWRQFTLPRLLPKLGEPDAQCTVVDLNVTLDEPVVLASCGETRALLLMRHR